MKKNGAAPPHRGFQPTLAPNCGARGWGTARVGHRSNFLHRRRVGGVKHKEYEEAIMSQLAAKTCVPCMGGVPPLAGEDLKRLQREVPQWEVVNGHHLKRKFSFPDFRAALAFVNKVGEIAEQQGHHPDIYLTWGKVEISIWTHKIDGLTESDFILAAKIDQVK